MAKKHSSKKAVKPALKPSKSSRRQIIALIGGALFLALGVFFIIPQATLDDWQYGKQNLATTTLTLPNGHKLSVEMARTPTEHEIGLMLRKSLAPDRGMLFIYNREAPHTFWMKNTLIDLDIIFIGADKRVTSVAANVPRTTAETPDADIPRRSGVGQYVLEIPAGRAKTLGIAAGTQLSFSIP